MPPDPLATAEKATQGRPPPFARCPGTFPATDIVDLQFALGIDAVAVRRSRRVCVDLFLLHARRRPRFPLHSSAPPAHCLRYVGPAARSLAVRANVYDAGPEPASLGVPPL